MAGINEWVKKIHEDKAFAKKFENLEDPKKIIAIAKENGYEITEQDLNDLKMAAAAGGKGFSLKDISWGEVFDGMTKYGPKILGIATEIYDSYLGGSNKKSNTQKSSGNNNIGRSSTFNSNRKSPF